MFDPKALRHFLDTLSDAVLVLDRSARVYHANAAAQRWLGVAAGASLQSLQARLGESLVQATQQVLSKGVPRLHAAAPALPEHVVLADGTSCTVSLTPLEGERWALRLEPRSTAVARPPAQTSSLSQELLRLFWESPFPACLQDADFRFIQVNPAFAEFTGFSADWLIGRDPVELQPIEDRELSLAYRVQTGAMSEPGQPSRLMERRLLHADGRERWCRATWRKWVDEAGQTRYLSILQDSTAEHVARERADRSARELDDWFDLSPVGMVLFDEQGLLVRTNPAFEALAGQVPVLMSEAEPGVQALLCWQDGRPLASLQPGASPVEAQAWVTQPDGPARRLRSALRCYRTASGQLRYMAVVEDRSAEEERDLAQMQIGALMDTAGVGLATFQESGGWVQHGSALPPSSGGEPAAASALQSIRREVVLPDSLPEYERLQQALRHGQRTEVRYAIRHPELGQRWLQTRVEPATLASGKRTTSVVTLDVTEQYQSQQRSDTLLREMTTILESTTAGMAYLRSGVLVRCNSRFEALLGVRAGQVVGCGLAELFASQPEAPSLVSAIEAALAADTVFEAELSFHVPGATTQWCALTVRRAGPGGDALEAIAVLSDITRLKAQQMELEALVRDRELMFSLSEVGIAFIRDDRVQRANQAMCRLVGLDANAMTGLPTSALYASEEEFLRLRAITRASMDKTGRWTGERQLRRHDGSLVWVQVSTRQIDDNNAAEGLIASYVNVDDRHRAQQAVALQAERTRAILDSVLVGIVTVGPGGIEWMNRSARRMFGGDLADFIGQPMSTVAMPGDEHPFRQTQYLHELVEGQAETFECKVKARDGREFWVVGNAVVTGRESTGRQLTYALLDIERRRQAEARTIEVQASLQRVIEAAPLAISLFDAQTLRVVQANQAAAHSIGLAPDQLVGRTPEELFEPAVAERYRADMMQALTAGAVTQREYRVETDGEARLWDARYLPMAATGAPPDQLLMVATDVTEQRAAQEARFEAAIAQREMLVKEVHHRIKNNLQGVAGLLQQIGARKPEMASAISEVVGQVQAIAQVYGLQVGATGPLRVKSVLEAITGSVQRTFGRTIRLTVEGPAHLWALPEAESIPIALTINELLTNAVKHSMAIDDPSAVHCSLACSEGRVQVGIANRGQLPPGFNLARYPGGVSGLGLVRALLPRRSATLTVEQLGDDVLATIVLVPPGVTRIEPV
ncbi:PAS domain S-box protein [Piscinibacter sp. HJYY11]|uniref:PAS domain S-box protein n=1 Tax=Piscinibacter sp. HJYY11 TaxID=2801333 RepID=UPI00191C9F0D|nr:PAS domain S-box protein [Piscinibacter sp. HJYY11]MBL0727567.1 PAS domain S-box protein [Piscinibacter sp. HJYY11]